MRNTDKHILDACLSDALAKLEGFARLEENWDSYDARPISQAALEQAGELLNRVQADWLATLRDSIAPYFLSPSPDGGIGIEWRGAAAHIEVEITPEGAVNALLIDVSGEDESYDEREALSLGEVSRLVGQVLAS